jgi:hypothetical protein
MASRYTGCAMFSCISSATPQYKVSWKPVHRFSSCCIRSLSLFHLQGEADTGIGAKNACNRRYLNLRFQLSLELELCDSCDRHNMSAMLPLSSPTNQHSRSRDLVLTFCDTAITAQLTANFLRYLAADVITAASDIVTLPPLLCKASGTQSLTSHPRESALTN